MFPGSVHEVGEPIEWDEDGEQARGNGQTLRRAVAELAATCLLAKHWPAEGQRHQAALSPAAGLLVRGGCDEARAVLIVYHAALAAGDEEARDRRQDVLTTQVAGVLDDHGAAWRQWVRQVWMIPGSRKSRGTAGAVGPDRSPVPARGGGRYGNETLVLSPLFEMVKVPAVATGV